jgi:hypothetical protein
VAALSNVDLTGVVVATLVALGGWIIRELRQARHTAQLRDERIGRLLQAWEGQPGDPLADRAPVPGVLTQIRNLQSDVRDLTARIAQLEATVRRLHQEDL